MVGHEYREATGDTLPDGPADDVIAHTRCADGLRHASFIPYPPTGLLWGGDAPRVRLSKKPLTHFRSDIFQLMYLWLFAFTGRWSVDQDARDKVSVIRLEAYFRNAIATR
jgi:hypothetical protein